MYAQKRAWPVLAASVLVLVGCDSQNPTALEDELPTTIIELSHMANASTSPTTTNSFRSLGTQSTDLLSAGPPSLGVVIDFESLAATGGDFTRLTTYSEDGFTLVNASDPTGSSALVSPHTDNSRWFVSSTALFNNFVNGVTVLTKDDGGTFNVTSIDVSELPPFGTAPRTVPFTGTRRDASTVSATFTTDGPIGFETFAFSGFTNLTSLSWVQVSPFHQFDNIVVALLLEVEIDIKPGSFPSSWDCREVDRGLPVAILSTTDFDATTVDANSVSFGKAGTETGEVHEKVGKDGVTVKRHVEDVNKDRLPDMVFHFLFGETGFSCADIPLGNKSVTLTGRLTGETQDGTAIEGEDNLRLVRDDPAIVAVGAGNGFSCALRSDGAAFCWGANGRGQLGDGTTTPSAAPVPVSGNHRFAQLIVGDVNACGVTAGGSAHCWGGNGEGQLGAGLATGSGQFSSVPVRVSGGHRFNNLSVGLRAVCGVVTTDGVTYCWGRNRNGELGNGTTGGLSNVPVAVSNSASLGFVTVSQGFFTTCALDGAGAAFCWGRDNGQFGNGSMTVPSSLTPTSAASGMTLAKIELGSVYTCGLDGSGGALCWGLSNAFGQQGIGSFVDPVLSPTAVVGGLTFASLDAHNNNNLFAATCGITTSNEAWCWGSNQKGQLGGPSAETCNVGSVFDCSSVPIEVRGDHHFTSIAVGLEHMCALALDGSVFCWGDNEFGQLGDGTMVNSPVPVAVRGL